jgi:predicted nucleic acid-binding protein
VVLTHLVDTSVLLDPPALALGDDARLVTSVICLGELEAGVLLATEPEVRAARLARLTAVTRTIAALGIDGRVASAFARLRATSARVPTDDVWVAATAVAHGLVLLTRDPVAAALPGVTAELV